MAKAVDEAGNFDTASQDFEIKGIESPEITSYSEKVSSGETIIIRGTSLPGINVRLVLSKSGDEVVATNFESDSSGEFVGEIETDKIRDGIYRLTAIAIDNRGAESEPSEFESVFVGSSLLISMGAFALKLLSVIIPLLALFFGCIYMWMHGWHFVKRTKIDLHRRIYSVDTAVVRSFNNLKIDIEKSIRDLERAQNNRTLTPEESAIIDRLRQNLEIAEEEIHEELLSMEKEIGE